MCMRKVRRWGCAGRSQLSIGIETPIIYTGWLGLSVLQFTWPDSKDWYDGVWVTDIGQSGVDLYSCATG
jgi:hypothetical protein